MSSLAQPKGTISLAEVLDIVAKAGEGDTVSVNDVVEAVGPRGFGPLILVPALIIVTPASGIPGLSSLGGLMIALLSLQYLLERNHAWLPAFIRERTVKRVTLEKAVGFLARPVGWIDAVLTRRMAFLTARPLSYLLVGACFLIGGVMPLFELVPMSSSILAAVVCLFGLALTTRDGVLALLAYGALFGAGWAIAQLAGVI